MSWVLPQNKGILLFLIKVENTKKNDKRIQEILPENRKNKHHHLCGTSKQSMSHIRGKNVRSLSYNICLFIQKFVNQYLCPSTLVMEYLCLLYYMAAAAMTAALLIPLPTLSVPESKFWE